MIICLSSGASQRYRQDVLRALALPIGSNLQFRYDTRWISDKTMEMIEGGHLVGQGVIIAYIDQSKADESVEGRYIDVIPVRIAKVSDAAVTGSTVALEFTIGTVAHAADLPAFNQELESLSGGALPKWVGKEPKGKYCAELTSEPANLEETTGIEQWQKTVIQLTEHDEFREESTFFTVLGLLSESERRTIGVKLAHAGWKQKVSPNSDNELLVYHFHANKPPADVTLSATVGEGLELASSPTVSIDSRYDLKRFRVRSLDPPLSRGSWISIGLKKKDSLELDIEIATTVKSDFFRRFVTGLVIASGLTATQAVAVLQSDYEGEVKAAAISLVLGGSLVVGMAAAFGLRRSY